MRTARTDPSRPRGEPGRAQAAPLAALVALLVLAAATLTGCHDGGGQPLARSASPRDVAKALDHVLDQRARAVCGDRPEAFQRLVAGTPAFRRQQTTWFGDLVQLPIQRLSYRFDPGTVVRHGSSYWVTVEESLQLRGYDAAPVVRDDRWRFRPAHRRGGRLVLTSVTDPAWEATHPAAPQPWDLGPVEVRAEGPVLGVFDAGSVADAPGVLDSVSRGVAAVAADVPYDWSRSVVVYALTQPTFLDGLADVPGDDPEGLDAVAFPVGRSTRFVLNPRMLDRAGPARDRLVRHELTHVALGTRDDDVPVWLSEGVAEWVSVRPMAPQDRRIPEAAVRAAEEGVPDLPDDADFNDADSQAHYGLAWWAVEYLADTYGDQEPWHLLDAMSRPGADPDRVLRHRYGLTTRALAHHAEHSILAVYEGVA
jgi:hypothetical protein